MTQSPIIVWFRRDLRLYDHRAIAQALQFGQPIIPVFIFDDALLKGRHASSARTQFMLNALTALDADLRQHGSRLLVRRGDSLAVLRQLIAETGAARVVFSLDFTPYARKRDADIMAALNAEGVRVSMVQDRLLVAPNQLLSGAGKPYTVYTPFKDNWRETIKTLDANPLNYELTHTHFYRLDGLDTPDVPTLLDLGLPATDVPMPPVSEAAALTRMNVFMQSRVKRYQDRRNTLANPGEDHHGTSFLSPYIRFGLISLRTIRRAAVEIYDDTLSDYVEESIITFMDEIIWHEFYTYVLWHFPHVTHANFNPKYDAVQWRDAPDELDAWKQGRTGYPVVDAAMRQLNALGWMHNRARMVVASFLTKHLLIDWREGERYFMQHLIDGDLAANNGGWQWAAGTGTDAQPYFRIFNPILQSAKFDLGGRFIRHWIPELREVSDKFIHAPWTMDTPPNQYPAPIVEHGMARERALAAFGVIKAGKDA